MAIMMVFCSKFSTSFLRGVCALVLNALSAPLKQNGRCRGDKEEGVRENKAHYIFGASDMHPSASFASLLV